MIKLIDKKTGLEKSRSTGDSIEDLIKEARKSLTKDAVYFRRRVSFDFYTVEIWSANPVTQPDKAEYVFDIEGVSRKMMARTAQKWVPGKPIKKPDFKPKNPKPKDPGINV